MWSWDITKLAGPVTTTGTHPYVMIDIFSRCAVHFEVHATENTRVAARRGARAGRHGRARARPGSHDRRTRHSGARRLGPGRPHRAVWQGKCPDSMIALPGDRLQKATANSECRRARSALLNLYESGC